MDHIYKPQKCDIALLNCNHYTDSKGRNLHTAFTGKLEGIRQAVSRVISGVQNVRGAVKWVYFYLQFIPIKTLSDSRKTDNISNITLLASLCRGFPDDRQQSLCELPQNIEIRFYLTTDTSMTCIIGNNPIAFETTDDICKWLKYCLTDMSVFFSLSGFDRKKWWESFIKKATEKHFISEDYVFAGKEYYHDYLNECDKYLNECVNTLKSGSEYEVLHNVNIISDREIGRPVGFVDMNDYHSLTGGYGSRAIRDCYGNNYRIILGTFPQNTHSEVILGKYKGQISNKKFNKKYNDLDSGQYVFVIFVATPTHNKKKQYARIKTILGSSKLKSWKFFTVEQYLKRIKEFKKVEGFLAIAVFKKK